MQRTPRAMKRRISGQFSCNQARWKTPLYSPVSCYTYCMPRLRLYYPLHPLDLISPRVNQSFGADPNYYAKFHDELGKPLKGHDGIDFYAPHGTPIRAAHDGIIHFEHDAHG